MQSVESYLQSCREALVPLAPTRLVLNQCLGTVLAQDLPAKLSVPRFDNSAMDGFAVRLDDVLHAAPEAPITLPVSGDVAAGDSPEPLQPGTCQRIMTGAPVPAGAEAVVPVEDTNIPAGPVTLPTEVKFTRAPKPGANIRRAGEDVTAGEVVLHAGTPLTPAALSSAAAVGYGKLAARPRVRVAVVVTGAELVNPGVAPEPGQIPDSNSSLVTGLVTSYGATLAGIWRSGDSPERFAEVFDQAASAADLVITTGGVSAGAFDVVKEVLSGRGVKFTKVAMKPGKPQGFGVIPRPSARNAGLAFTDADGFSVGISSVHEAPAGTPDSVVVMTLPGNPVSVFVSFQLFVRPVMAALQGIPDWQPHRLLARAATGWDTRAERRQYIPARLVFPNPLEVLGKASPAEAQQRLALPLVTPSHRLGSGSHLVASLPVANSLVVVPAEQNKVTEGELLEVIIW